MSDNGWIGVDLDGTLAHYDGWQGREHIGDPITPMLERVLAWLTAGQRVKIFTARVSGELSAAASSRRYIEAWLERHGIGGLEVTNVKDFEMTELWDDRAVRVVFNTGEPCRGEQVVPVVTEPTGKELRAVWMEDVVDESIVLVREETGKDDHGYSYERIFHRVADDTYWTVSGVNQGEGEYDTLRDDPKYIAVTRVYPHTVTRTEYTGKP